MLRMTLWSYTTLTDSARGPLVRDLHVTLSVATYANEFEAEWEAVSKGPEYIRWLQDSLNRILGLRLAVDGIFGPRTRAAVIGFQQRSGLTPDGIPGPKTDSAIKKTAGQLALSDPCAGLGRPEVLERFDFARHTLKPFHHEQLIRIARCVVASRRSSRPIKAIRLTGHTDPVGSDLDNSRLGQLRADEVQRQLMATLERISPGSSRGLGFVAESRGETQQIPGSPERTRRVELFVLAPPAPPVPVPSAPTRVVKTLKVVVKSFIAPIGAKIGTPTCPVSFPPGLPPVPAAATLAGLAAITDVSFPERPTTDAKDKGYRLYSERTFTVTCENGSIISATSSPVDTDAGKEGPIQPPPLITSRVSGALVGRNFRFAWMARGRPDPSVEKLTFQAVCSRTSVFIWHLIAGEIECVGTTPVVRTSLVGSQFPSHRVFVNGIEDRAAFRAQGPFSNLWIPHPADRTMVR